MNKKMVLLISFLVIAIGATGCSKKAKATTKLHKSQIVRLSEPQAGCTGLITYNEAIRDSSKEAENFKSLLENNASGCSILPAYTDLTVMEIAESHDGYDIIGVSDMTSAFSKKHGFEFMYYTKWNYSK